MFNENTKNKIKFFAEEGLDFLFPQNIYCLCCGDSMESTRIHGICDVCAEKIDWNISNPFERDMDEFAFDALLPCCRYGFYPRQIMHRFKLGGNPYGAKPIGRLLGERLAMSGLDFQLITCVPMHKDKKSRRGFNQSELLGKHASETYFSITGKKIPFLPEILEKPMASASMRMQSGKERRAILSSTFHTSSQYADIIRSKKIVLVDDVVTTGSTSDACARTLKEAGADKVYVLCFAGSSGFVAGTERSM